MCVRALFVAAALGVCGTLVPSSRSHIGERIASVVGARGRGRTRGNVNRVDKIKEKAPIRDCSVRRILCRRRSWWHGKGGKGGDLLDRCNEKGRRIERLHSLLRDRRPGSNPHRPEKPPASSQPIESKNKKRSSSTRSNRWNFGKQNKSNTHGEPSKKVINCCHSRNCTALSSQQTRCHRRSHHR